MAKRVVKLRTPAGKCAICGAGDDVRDRVDAILARHGEKDAATGERLTWPYLVDVVVPHVLGRTVSLTSVRRHLGTYGGQTPHTQLVDDDEQAKALEEAAGTVEAGELLEEIDRLLDGDTVSPTAVLGLQLRAWALSLRRRVALGEEITMTSDQAQRAASVLLKTEHQAAEQALLGALAGGISAAFEGAMSSGRQGHALPRGMPEIVDHEPIVPEEDADVVPPAPPPPPSRPVPPLLIEDAPAETPSEPPVEVVVEPVPSSTDERRGGYREKRDA